MNIPTDDQWRDFYSKVWTVLVTHAGASPKAYDREIFVATMLEANDCQEFRFQGVFGFGGKFRRDHSGRMRITYYVEDNKAFLDALQVRINGLLAAMQKDVIGGPVYGCPAAHQRYIEYLEDRS